LLSLCAKTISSTLAALLFAQTCCCCPVHASSASSTAALQHAEQLMHRTLRLVRLIQTLVAARSLEICTTPGAVDAATTRQPSTAVALLTGGQVDAGAALRRPQQQLSFRRLWLIKKGSYHASIKSHDMAGTAGRYVPVSAAGMAEDGEVCSAWKPAAAAGAAANPLL
jgi:hypothetical protein